MTFTKDSRGVAEFTAIEPANAFSTFTSTQIDTLTASKILDTLTGYRYCLTNIILNAATSTVFTLLEDTTTSKLVWSFGASGGQKDFYFPTPIMFATGTAPHVTIDATGCSAYFGGYYKA